MIILKGWRVVVGLITPSLGAVALGGELGYVGGDVIHRFDNIISFFDDTDTLTRSFIGIIILPSMY